MDEVLYLLIKKKFRDLGEFVEGKEEMDIVINKSYHDEKEAMRAICLADTNSDDDVNGKLEGDSLEDQNYQTLINEDVFQHEIEELGEEQAALKPDDEDEENGNNNVLPSMLQRKKPSTKSTQSKIDDSEVIEDAVGSSQQQAICLSDDEEEEMNQEKMSDHLEYFRTNNGKLPRISKTTKIPNTRMYYLYFDAPSYGFLVSLFFGRLVVTTTDHSNEKMMTGDFIFSVNDVEFPLSINNGVEIMRRHLMSPPVRVIFIRNEDFSCLFREHTQHIIRARDQQEQSKKRNGEAETIEILDD